MAADPARVLAVDICRRARDGEGVVLREMEERLPAHNCHENVREWVGLHPEFRQVYGFCVIGEPDSTVILAHSAIEAPDGTLWNITASNYPRLLFVRHVGPEADFNLIAHKQPFWVAVPNVVLRNLGLHR
jgi:hypothetical protein